MRMWRLLLSPRFPLPELTARVNGPSWRVMETGHPSTRAVNSGSGNRALLLLLLLLMVVMMMMMTMMFFFHSKMSWQMKMTENQWRSWRRAAIIINRETDCVWDSWEVVVSTAMWGDTLNIVNRSGERSRRGMRDVNGARTHTLRTAILRLNDDLIDGCVSHSHTCTHTHRQTDGRTDRQTSYGSVLFLSLSFYCYRIVSNIIIMWCKSFMFLHRSRIIGVSHA